MLALGLAPLPRGACQHPNRFCLKDSAGPPQRASKTIKIYIKVCDSLLGGVSIGKLPQKSLIPNEFVTKSPQFVNDSISITDSISSQLVYWRGFLYIQTGIN